MAEKEDARGSDESLKLAVAISILRSKILKNANDSNALSPSQSNSVLRWKRKAKERKQEILRLREDLKDAQDVSHCDLFPESAACKCYFFDNFGEVNPKHNGTGCDSRFSDVLRRRFLRQVRFKERRRKIGSPSSSKQRLSLGSIKEDEAEQLRASVDFLVELCSSLSPVDDSKFVNLAHQAVDFILVTLKNLLSMGRNQELVEGIVNSLVTRLTRQMCTSLSENGSQYTGTNAQFCVQHLIRKLGSEPYIGQRAILSVSQRLLELAERLLFCDPFDDGFPKMHECFGESNDVFEDNNLSIFYAVVRIQLIEFLVADYLLEWSKAEDFDNVLLEDWVTSIEQARKALELLESRNGLYALYMDRVAGELAKQLGGVSSCLKLKPDIINCLFR